jgi:hypothetical protein
VHFKTKSFEDPESEVIKLLFLFIILFSFLLFHIDF